MTTGQRIASKRKELNLSQESLGETLGVSRQSIYRWESDGTLPEIDKLVAMSRLFGVSVGWLLGVEELPEQSDDSVLTEGQLKMVEEILHRYQPAPQQALTEMQCRQVEELVSERLTRKPEKRRRWLRYILVAAFLVIAVIYLSEQLEEMNRRYDQLASSLNSITNNVNRDISSITNRVEEVLKTQNHLTAEYDTELLGGDLATNTVSFSAWAVPKTYTEGMAVVFLADCGDGVLEFVGQQGQGREYQAEITCPLTDNITLSAVFTIDGVSQTQVLDTYTNLYSSSLPYMDIEVHRIMWKNAETDDPYTFKWKNEYVNLRLDGYTPYRNGYDLWEQAEATEVKVGLFLNRELVRWLPSVERPENYYGNTDDAFYLLTDLTLNLEKGDLLQICALVTDEYGRTFLQPQEMPPFTPIDGELEYAAHVYAYEGIQDPTDWGISIE